MLLGKRLLTLEAVAVRTLSFKSTVFIRVEPLLITAAQHLQSKAQSETSSDTCRKDYKQQ